MGRPAVMQLSPEQRRNRAAVNEGRIRMLSDDDGLERYFSLWTPHLR
jgi:hypothetical protein